VAFGCFDSYKFDYSPQTLTIIRQQFFDAFHGGFSRICYNLRMPRSLKLLFVHLPVLATNLFLENLALRQQFGVLKRRRPQPRFAVSDKLFWVILRRLWPGWKQALVLVQPQTVIRWHRSGFKLYWAWLSRHRTRVGRKCVSRELSELIFRMVAENPTWGAPRIHGELKMPGFDISERTVLRWMRKAPKSPEPAKRWAAFLSNHREAIAAMDFFTAPSRFAPCSPCLHRLRQRGTRILL
jgi:hypothetical protein